MLKNLSLIIASIFIINGVFAQEPISKKGNPILPHKGDWGIGFDAVPVLKYAGNIFHDSNNHSDLSINYPLSITARYLHTDKMAYRLTVGLSLKSLKTDTLVPKQGSTNTNEQVADETTENNFKTLLGFGVQRWIGKSRVRGYYGGEANIMIATANTKYNYGNALGAQNPVNNRIKQLKEGSTFGFGLRGFIGVELYIAPKISLSAEYGLSPFSITAAGANEIKDESWDGSAVITETKSTKGKISSFTAATDNHNGSVSLLFYFSR